jgi:D-alanyl-D-alanine carboxypeptidase
VGFRFLFLFIFSFFEFSNSNSAYARYAAVVVDHHGNILHEENATASRHPASLTKKMTLYLLFEALRNKKISMNTRFTTSQLATRQAPTKINLHVGESITVETCIKALIAKSANDVAVVVAEGLGGNLKNFVKMMNKKADQLGMTCTHFRNASGLPDPKQVTSALDMVKLAKAIYTDFPEYYHFFQTQSFAFKGNLFYTHNHMLKSFPGLDGLKTGFINASGFNISTSAVRYAGDKEHRLFVVVMGGQTSKSRDRRAAQLLEANFQKVLSNQKKGSIVAPGIKGVRKSTNEPITTEHSDLNSFVMDTSLQKVDSLPQTTTDEASKDTHPVESPQTQSQAGEQTSQSAKPAPIVYGQSPLTQDMHMCLAPQPQQKNHGPTTVLALPLQHNKGQTMSTAPLSNSGLPAQWVVGTLPAAALKKEEKPTTEKTKKAKALKRRNSRPVRA